MSDSVKVGVALSSRAWRGNLQRHCRDHEADVFVTLLQQGSDAVAQRVDVIVVDDDTSWLSVPFVDQVRAAGLVVIGVFDPDDGDGHGRSALATIGVDVSIPSTLEVEGLVDAIRRHRPDPVVERRFAELRAGVEAPKRRSPVVAVGGPSGAGATEVAVALAAVDRGAGRTLLVDLDDTHPSIARRLGLALHPHLLTAVDVVRHEPLDPHAAAATLVDCVARPGRSGRPTPFDVLPGLVGRDDWSLVRADDVVDLVDAVAAEWSLVLLRVGPQLEDLGRYAPRFEISRRGVARADHVIGVCDATATGLLRFVDWLVDLLGIVGDRPVDVVLNRAPRSPARRSQLIDQLRVITGGRLGEITCVPFDRRVERAMWDGDVVAPGPFTKALGPVLAAAARTEAVTA